MKKLIVHIGYHKTGTSFLNRKFFPIHPDIFHLGKPYDDDDPIREFTERVIGVRRYDVERCRHYIMNILNLLERIKLLQ